MYKLKDCPTCQDLLGDLKNYQIPSICHMTEIITPELFLADTCVAYSYEPAVVAILQPPGA